MIGFSRSHSARITRWLGCIAARVAPGCAGPLAPVTAREPERTAPVQKPLPVAVRTTARMSGSSPQRASAFRYASRISGFMALRASGRLRTIHPTPSSTSNLSKSVTVGLLRSRQCGPARRSVVGFRGVATLRGATGDAQDSGLAGPDGCLRHAGRLGTHAGEDGASGMTPLMLLV